MIDSFEMMRSAIEADGTRAAMGLDPAPTRWSRCTGIERRQPRSARALVDSCSTSPRAALVFAVHPRTRRRLEEFGLLRRLDHPRIQLTEPLATSSS